MITEFPLLIFTVLASIAGGSYVGAALFPRRDEGKRAWLFPLVMLVLVAIAGLGAMMHLERPQNIMNVLNNPTSSLTMEGFASGALALVALIDTIICWRKGASNRVVRIIGAVVAVLLFCAITYAYVSSYGNPAWCGAPSYLVFILVGLMAGMSTWFCWSSEDDKREALVIGIISALAAIVLIWQGVLFATLAAAGAPLIIIGAILAAIAAFFACASGLGKFKSPAVYKIVVVVAILSLILSRYGFYMASII